MTKLTPEKWDNAMIVFDTSAICKMYDMTDSTKTTLIEVLDFLKNRIWIPGQVIREYERNRIKVIHNPSKERYSIPKIFDTSSIATAGKNFLNNLESNPDYHPYLKPDKLTQLKEKFRSVLESLKTCKEIIEEEFSNRKAEIESLVENDLILSKIHEINHGSEFDFNRMMEICREGEIRYRNSIPPGYEDSKPQNGKIKIGLNIYGDLLVWKQLLEEAKSQNKDVIFICNDEKEDWWEDYKKKKFRWELHKEFTDYTGRVIYANSLEAFIEDLKERYKDESQLEFYEGLEAVKDVLEYYQHFTSPTQTDDDVFAILKCYKCGYKNRLLLQDLDLDWEENEWSEREMGPEVGYTADTYCSCKECGHELELNFHLCEYPAGRVEDLEVEAKECEILNNPHWLKNTDLPFDTSSETCLYCGRTVHSLTHDLCDECLDEFNYKVTHD